MMMKYIMIISSQKSKSSKGVSLSSNQTIFEKMSSNEKIQINDNNKNSISKLYNKINMNKFDDSEDIDKKYILPDGELEKHLMKSPEELDFDEASTEDKRNFCEMYKDTLLSRHIFLQKCIPNQEIYT